MFSLTTLTSKLLDDCSTYYTYRGGWGDRPPNTYESSGIRRKFPKGGPKHRRSQGMAKGAMPPPKFVENIVILCFKRRFSKQNSVIRLKLNILVYTAENCSYIFYF